MVEPELVEALSKERTLRIRWSDSHESRYPYRYLRGFCPCAACQGHRAGWDFVVNDGPALVAIGEVGNYALSLRFADGHQTGIYSFDVLRKLCPCQACQERLGDEHPMARTPS